MGFNTAVLIVNDGLGQIQRHPRDFVRGICERTGCGGSFGVEDHAGIVTVTASAHADAAQLIAVGGNYSTKMFTGLGVARAELNNGFLPEIQQDGWFDTQVELRWRNPFDLAVDALTSDEWIAWLTNHIVRLLHGPAAEHLSVMHNQLSDIRQLRADAEQRAWTDEIKRHDRVINALEHHCSRLENTPTTTRSP